MLSWSQRISYGVGHTLNELCATMWFSYLIVYLQLVLRFDSNFAGLVLLIGQVADAIATPLLGYETSHSKGSKVCQVYGKNKFLHLIGTVCVAVSFPFIFSVCPGCQNASQYAFTIMLVPLVIIFQIGWAAVQVSHLSLIPVITPHESERDFLNVLRYAVNIASDIGTYVIVWCVFDLGKTAIGSIPTITEDYADKFLMITLIIVGLGSFFSIVFHVGVKEVPNSQISSVDICVEQEKKQANNASTNLSWKDWIREKHFYQVSFLYMFTRLYQNMGMVFMPLYLHESLRANNDFMAKIPLIMNVSGFIMSCFLPKFFKLLSKKLTFLLGAVLGLGACTWISVDHGTRFCSEGIYVVGAMLGASSSMIIVSSLSFTHDLIGTSTESGAFVYGCMSFWDKIANGIVGMFVQYMHSVSCKDCDWFYRDVMSYGVGGIVILSSVVLLTLFPAKLGKRTSTYKRAKSFPPEQNGINYHSIIDSEETKPLLEKP